MNAVYDRFFLNIPSSSWPSSFLYEIPTLSYFTLVCLLYVPFRLSMSLYRQILINWNLCTRLSSPCRLFCYWKTAARTWTDLHFAFHRGQPGVIDKADLDRKLVKSGGFNHHDRHHTQITNAYASSPAPTNQFTTTPKENPDLICNPGVSRWRLDEGLSKRAEQNASGLSWCICTGFGDQGTVDDARRNMTSEEGPGDEYP